MPDFLEPEDRSALMSRIRGKDTQPEKKVRSALYRMGYRFRLHDKKLPGCPDIVLKRHGKVIFVNGCFWHGHRGCKRSGLPSTNAAFWAKKIEENRSRDCRVKRMLSKQGWRVLTIWECQTRDSEELDRIIAKFMNGGS